MAALDGSKPTPVAPQAKLACEAAGAAAYCAAEAFVDVQQARFIACSCTAADCFCIFNCQVKSFGCKSL